VRASFYFDLASPTAYLAAERILQVLPGPAEWVGVLARELPAGERIEALGRGSERRVSRVEIARRAEELGLQPLRWPDPFPFDSALAMRVATYASSIGRAVPFAQAAFRQAFAGGHDLGRAEVVLIAAAACEMHPAAVLRAAELRSVERQLARATARAAEVGVRAVPAVLVEDARSGARGRVFSGERLLEQAAAHIGEEAAAGGR
jgi:2-hydroxychromene-2-carboxylate isomerase